MKEYFGKNKACIYIDQFAASKLFDEPSSALCREVADVIEQKFKDGKIICPVPTEHFLESANKTRERAFIVDAKLNELGNGLAFLPEAAIATNYMIVLLRQQPIGQQIFCAPLKYSGTISQQGAYDEFKERHQDLKAKVNEAAAAANELRDVLSGKRFSRAAMEPMY